MDTFESKVQWGSQCLPVQQEQNKSSCFCLSLCPWNHYLSGEQSLSFLEGAVPGRLPNGQAEGNLVYEVSKVIDEVQCIIIDRTHEVAKEVTQRVNAPANCHDESHCAEGRLHVLVDRALTSCLSSLTHEDLK